MPISPINVIIIGAGTGGLLVAADGANTALRDARLMTLPAVKRKLVTFESTFRGAGRDQEG